MTRDEDAQNPDGDTAPDDESVRGPLGSVFASPGFRALVEQQQRIADGVPDHVARSFMASMRASGAMSAIEELVERQTQRPLATFDDALRSSGVLSEVQRVDPARLVRAIGEIEVPSIADGCAELHAERH